VQLHSGQKTLLIHSSTKTAEFSAVSVCYKSESCCLWAVDSRSHAQALGCRWACVHTPLSMRAIKCRY